MEALSPDSLHKEILSKKDDIVRGVVESLVQQVSTSTYYGLHGEISGEVTKIVKEQMLDEIKAAITDSKPQILAALTESIAKVSAEIGSAMVKRVATNMEGYTGREVLKKLFD